MAALLMEIWEWSMLVLIGATACMTTFNIVLAAHYDRLCERDWQAVHHASSAGAISSANASTLAAS